MYPKVLGELDTLEQVLQGKSIARFGDGELKIIRHGNCVSQLWRQDLANELKNILFAHTTAITGIPTLDKRGPKIRNWKKLESKFEEFTNPTKQYGSAFISRPDSAPWINTKEFFDKIESLWRGQEVILVANGKRSLTAEFLQLTGATRVRWIECPYRDAYSDIDELMRQVMWFSGVKRVILCVGPTATCMAERLAQNGKHAVDLGHVGLFWRRYQELKNPIAAHVEQREINKDTGQVEPNP